ncbi:hypothetical protein FB639_003699, partial [Coemansia asiatica]
MSRSESSPQEQLVNSNNLHSDILSYDSTSGASQRQIAEGPVTTMYRDDDLEIVDVSRLSTEANANINNDNENENENENDEESELNRMISNIGFGRYHRRVLALCGLGWLADNMWMQCVACILPRVQQHFGVSNSRIGLMSSSMFLGLMCGAL